MHENQRKKLDRKTHVRNLSDDSPGQLCAELQKLEDESRYEVNKYEYSVERKIRTDLRCSAENYFFKKTEPKTLRFFKKPTFIV